MSQPTLDEVHPFSIDHAILLIDLNKNTELVEYIKKYPKWKAKAILKMYCRILDRKDFELFGILNELFGVPNQFQGPKFIGTDVDILRLLLSKYLQLTPPPNLADICKILLQFSDGYEYLEIMFARGFDFDVLQMPPEGFQSAFENNADSNLSRIGEEVFKKLSDHIAEEKQTITKSEAKIHKLQKELAEFKEISSLITMDFVLKVKELHRLRGQVLLIQERLKEAIYQVIFHQELLKQDSNESVQLKLNLYQNRESALQQQNQRLLNSMKLIQISDTYQKEEIKQQIEEKSDEIDAETFDIIEQKQIIAAKVKAFFESLIPETKADMIASCLIYCITVLSTSDEILIDMMPQVITSSGLKQQIYPRLQSINVNDTQNGIEGQDLQLIT
ncbi:hypothetical protein FGO68_gene3568 [Halteria grandinella]|uniref:Uncharacterized protein n=1 Tax=Halteria grandinella TaxID=5974 RepID=A0A8J8NPW0_HALGN|nr:hypothetical protein FGO68_gene3568 [Halteria grandinella]